MNLLAVLGIALGAVIVVLLALTLMITKLFRIKNVEVEPLRGVLQQLVSKDGDTIPYPPDIVIIKLGTNDSKPQNWQHGTEFAADLAALIDAFRALPGAPAVWVCRPVPAFPGGYGIRPRS